MIKVKVDSLKEDISNLSVFMENFRPYSDNYVSQIADSLDDFNSDFISKIIDILSNMKDTEAPDLMANLDDFYISLKSVVEGFEETDENIGSNTKSEINNRGEN